MKHSWRFVFIRCSYVVFFLLLTVWVIIECPRTDELAFICRRVLVGWVGWGGGDQACVEEGLNNQYVNHELAVSLESGC